MNLCVVLKCGVTLDYSIVSYCHSNKEMQFIDKYGVKTVISFSLVDKYILSTPIGEL